MGSKQNSKKIDASVGGLVWVRRRNGSWWPGRIMGLHELSANCLVSPKSGTPVKLLGREDASLDWYNLEKSKRVKAFRCGEFGECIEKAKASAAHSNKKAVKYARREDAILHALELESAHETNKHHGNHKRMDGYAGKHHDSWVRQTQNMYSSGKGHECMDGEGSKLEANSMQELSQSGISFEDPNDSTHKVHSLLKKRRKTPNDSEDDGTEGTKRMRGLKDLVMGVEAKRETNINTHTEGSAQLDCASVTEPDICNSLSTRSHINSSKHFFSSLKRRRSQVASICENLKRKNRRRQLTKVLESTAMVSVPVFCDEGASSGGLSFQGMRDRNFSALESTELKKSNDSLLINNKSDFTGVLGEKQTSLESSEYTNGAGISSFHCHPESKNSKLSSMSEIPENECFDSLFDVPFVEEETRFGGFSPIFAPCASRKFRSVHSSQVGSISLRSEGLNKNGSTNFAIKHNNVSQRTKKGTSRWQSKGKRNSRSLGKKTKKSLDSRSVDGDEGMDDFLAGSLSVCISPEVHNNTLGESLMSDNGARWSNQIGEPKYLDSTKYGTRSSGNREVLIHSSEVRGGKFKSLSREKSVLDRSTTKVRSLPVLPTMPPRSPSHHQSYFTSNSRYEISDVSSINFPWGPSLFDVNLEVKASYSCQNVPLVSLMSKLSGKAIVGHPLTVEVCNDGYCDLLISSLNYSPTSSSGKLIDSATENLSDQSIDEGSKAVGPMQAETGYTDQFLEAPWKKSVKHSTFKSPNRSPKNRKCGLNSKKTRKLSSFSLLPRQEEKRKAVVEKLKGAVMACVPLKVVFSRISESLNCSRRTF
ncbi:PWWP domain [Macleaya cordata]|uniref:PWWP domain n=1 Tax=Macleaya cordata TaxID=56857 RepID=A0A200QDI4_MACCD|nr:PWWP domain [Macleaya cordata]